MSDTALPRIILNMIQVRNNYISWLYRAQELLFVKLFAILKTGKFGLGAADSFAVAIDGIEQLTCYAGTKGPNPGKGVK